MVAFRRCFFALAVVILLSSLASAQTNTTPFTCSAAVSVPPLLRSEGYTEQIGDIVLTCTGGNTSQFTIGSPLPTANITVSLATQVSSRLLSTSTTPNISEALLMIDEPGSALPQPVPGSGPGAPQTLCGTPTLGAGVGGCQQFPITVSTGGGPITVMSSSSTTVTNPANMYLGLWNSVAPNQITFQGVPILPAVSSGITRVYRITNIRANVSGLSGAGFAGTQQLAASVSISSATSITINQPVQIAGFIEASLSTTTRNLANTGSLGTPGFAQCASEGSPTPTGILQYQEIFATAFKVRNNGGQGSALTQNIPGVIYNSESGFEVPTSGVSGLGTPTGLADYSTRFQATFHNIPSGVRMFVSVNNVTNSSTVAPTTSSAAVLVSGSTIVDTSTVGSNGGIAAVPAVSATTTVAGIALAEIIPDSTGTAIAVWESLTNNPAAIDTYDFTFYQLYSSTSGINSPPIPAGSGSVTATVNMSYAPIPPAGSSSSTLLSWAQASGSLTIPRFADTSTAQNAFSISICQTVLLFPFVTNTNGFDTGIAISNTTQDPLGTKNQVGVCNLAAYGSSAPTSQTACTSSSTATGLFCMPGTGTTGYNIGAGTTSATLASAIAPGFQGYIVAICNFQLAHGFAFISDVGARNLAMGYLALVTGTPSNNSPGSARNSINEAIAH